MGRHVHVLFAVFLLISTPSLGQMILPTGFTATDLISSGLSSATCMCVAPDGTIYIAQKNGALRIWREGAGLLATQFFANQPLNVQTSGERGLIGLALDPNFAINRFVYVHYTVNSTPRHGRISRFTADTDGNLAIPGSETVLLELDSLSSIYHNGGAMHFGPDGKLYIGVGENFVSSNSQSITSLLGKILRINPVPGDVIPSDNPTSFPGISGTPTGNNRAIWAVGLRNPFTFAFQPGTGRMFINDVGDSAFEEIDEGAPGRNFGWPTTEGMFDSSQYPAFTAPLYAYQHNPDFGGGVCIIGGVFCDSQTTAFPASFDGDYFFADFQQNSWIRRLDLTTGQVSDFAWLFNSPVDLDLDAQGRLLLLIGGKLTRIEYSVPPRECRTPEVATLDSIDSANGSGFGAALAVSGNTAVVSAPFVDTANGGDAGAVSVFTRDEQNWNLQAMLTAPDGAFGDWFGMSVAISGERVLIGSPWNDGGNVSHAGAAYVFARNGDVWTLETKLIAPDPGVQDFFGMAVAMTSDIAMIGATQRNFGNISEAGAVYVFTRSGTTWIYDSTLVSSDPSTNADFGASISMEANRSLIGASSGNANKGCAYIFERVNGAWIQKARLVATDGVANDQLGCAVSLSGESALVGARNATPISVLSAGAAYLFSQAGDTWTQTHKFTAPNPNAYGAFGSGVHLSDNRAIIGAPYSSRDGELFQGIAYVHSQSNGEWALDTTLVVSDAVQNDCFGNAIATDDNVVLIGQDLNNFATTEAGTVYAFVVPAVNGDIDLDGDIDLADASMFVNALMGVDSIPIHRSRADMNCDGSPNGLDISPFVNILISTPP